jgi:hypothetical protein
MHFGRPKGARMIGTVELKGAHEISYALILIILVTLNTINTQYY